MTNKLFRFFSTIGLILMLAMVFYTPAAASTSQASAPRSTISHPFAITQTLVSLTSPIKRGAYATIIVHSIAGAHCSITVYYKSGPSTAKGLGPKTAGSDGRCAWTWKVGTATTPGTWRIAVATNTATKTYWFVVK